MSSTISTRSSSVAADPDASGTDLLRNEGVKDHPELWRIGAGHLEIGDAFPDFADQPGVSVDWAPFRLGEQTWIWQLPEDLPGGVLAQWQRHVPG